MTAWKNRDIEYKVANNLRCRLNMAIKNKSKAGSAVKNLGCSIEYFMKYIEQQFSEGMSWENWGRNGWHLDHITPLSSFDLTDIEQFKLACHYKNYRPLWAKDNLKKASKNIFPKLSVEEISETHTTSYRRKTNRLSNPAIKNKDNLIELHNKGLSSYKIAEELNCSPTNVRYWIRKLKI